MSKDISYVDNTTVVPANNLNDDQEIATGQIWGTRLDLQTTNTQVRLLGDALTENQFSIRIGLKPRYGTTPISATGAGSSGTRDIFVTSGTGDTPKAPGLEVDVTGGTPSTTYYRKIGEATWSGSAYTNLRVTNGIQANADQYNNFIFQPLIASSTPLTVRGLASQSSDYFRVEDSTATALLRVAGTTTIAANLQASSSFQGADGTVGSPSYAFTSHTNTGFYQSNANEISVASNGGQVAYFNANGFFMPTSSITAPITFNSDVALYRSAANTLALATGDSLNIISGSLLFGGVAIASSNLSDTSNIARLSASTFTNPIQIPTGTAGSPAVQIAGDPNTGLYSPGADQMGLATAGIAGLTLNAAGLVTLPVAGVSAGLALANGTQIYSGSGGTYVGTANMGHFAASLEVRKSNGASGLILSRPDGTRILIQLDNTNTLQFSVAP